MLLLLKTKFQFCIAKLKNIPWSQLPVLTKFQPISETAPVLTVAIPKYTPNYKNKVASVISYLLLLSREKIRVMAEKTSSGKRFSFGGNSETGTELNITAGPQPQPHHLNIYIHSLLTFLITSVERSWRGLGDRIPTKLIDAQGVY